MIHRQSRGSAFAAALLMLAIQTVCTAQAVVVESADAAAERTRRSAAFLTPPSTSGDRYENLADWRDVPPWRQTSFCGVRARGTFFVFVIDCSGSMAEPERWLRVREEMNRTLARLQFPQRYYVILYNDQPLAMPGGMPQSAATATTRRTLDWLNRIVPEGPTDPRSAMSEALAHKPHAVFLLTDGEFPEGSANAIAAANPSGVPIHCIDLSDGAGTATLKAIAASSGGEYRAP